MQLNTLIVGVLFLAFPLMMFNFGNRYSLLAGLIGDLHNTVINEKILTGDSLRFSSNRQPSPKIMADCHHPDL